MSKLSGEQLMVLERSIEDYHFKNVFSDIYRQYDKELASEVL